MLHYMTNRQILFPHFDLQRTIEPFDDCSKKKKSLEIRKDLNLAN